MSSMMDDRDPSQLSVAEKRRRCEARIAAVAGVAPPAAPAPAQAPAPAPAATEVPAAQPSLPKAASGRCKGTQLEWDEVEELAAINKAKGGWVGSEGCLGQPM
jgi:hypothetical protein